MVHYKKWEKEGTTCYRVSLPLTCARISITKRDQDSLLLVALCLQHPTMADTTQLALLDTGHLGEFFGLRFDIQHQILVCLKQTPNVVESVNGSTLSSGPVTQETVPLEVWIRKCWELLCIPIDLICSPHFSVILGIPWLSLHNPDILWGQRDLQFGRHVFQEAHWSKPRSGVEPKLVGFSCHWQRDHILDHQKVLVQ